MAVKDLTPIAIYNVIIILSLTIVHYTKVYSFDIEIMSYLIFSVV